MDTPETVDPRKAVQCYGPEASARAHQLLDNQRVGISTDQSQGDRDRYGRKLAYVWLPDGRNYAETMIRDGYAREYTYDKAYIYKVAFKLAQEDAQREHAGLWGKCS
jgi:micrococcal nuclease